jgi:hypothetical protein
MRLRASGKRLLEATGGVLLHLYSHAAWGVLIGADDIRRDDHKGMGLNGRQEQAAAQEAGSGMSAQCNILSLPVCSLHSG